MFSSTFEDHIDHLRTVFQRLKKYGVKLKPKKCTKVQKRSRVPGKSCFSRGMYPTIIRLFFPVNTIEPLMELHDNMAHLGGERVLRLARDRFYWQRMPKDVEHYVRNICRCVKQKPPRLKTRAPLQPIVTTSRFELVSIDFVHLEKSSGR